MISTTSRPTGGWTIGVEQEFLLVDPRSREPVTRAPEVRAAVDPGPDLDVQHELTPCQIEVATGVCTDTAAGVPPVGDAGPPPGTDLPRYHRIAEEHGRLVEGQGVCGCHVHIGLEDRRTAIEIGNRLRPWLPVLLALSANSPVYQGFDTGYVSWRYLVWSHWPVSGPPPFFESAQQYDRAVDALVASGC